MKKDMTEQEILSHVDHTMLKPFCTWEDLVKLCEEAMEFHMASVCVPPCYVKKVREKFGKGLNICTVIGFPLGYNTTEVKLAETKKALEDGADEIDMVANISDIKNKDYQAAEREIRMIKQVTGEKILKVIIETCYLTEEEKVMMCCAVTDGGADFIKTSTGFGNKGANINDIQLLKENIGPGVKIKAAGGIRRREEMQAFLQAGCSRIGTSAAMELIKAK